MISQVFHSTGVYLLSHVDISNSPWSFSLVSTKLSPLQMIWLRTTCRLFSWLFLFIHILVCISDILCGLIRSMFPCPVQKKCSDIIRSQQTTFRLNHAVRNKFTSPITEERSISHTIRCTYVPYILKAPNREKDKRTDPVPASPANQTATSDFSSPFSVLSHHLPAPSQHLPVLSYALCCLLCCTLLDEVEQWQLSGQFQVLCKYLKANSLLVAL